MRRCLGKACAGVLMLAAAGCFDTFLWHQVVVSGPKVVVPGTVAEVSATLQDGLSDAGILLQTNRVGPEFRIASQWKSGTCFCLHLYPNKDKNSKVNKTEVHVRWDRPGDPELWQFILKILEVPAEEGGAAKPAT